MKGRADSLDRSETHPDDLGLPIQRIIRHAAVIATVLAVVAIVPHDEIAIRRDDLGITRVRHVGRAERGAVDVGHFEDTMVYPAQVLF